MHVLFGCCIRSMVSAYGNEPAHDIRSMQTSSVTSEVTSEQGSPHHLMPHIQRRNFIAFWEGPPTPQ